LYHKVSRRTRKQAIICIREITEMMDVHFACTQCGKCCSDFKLPLTVSEAIDWLTAGHDVQLVCEGMPWALEPSSEDAASQHRRRRSFETISGSMPIRVVVILAANLAGRCPNLQADLRCGIYEQRPLVCRIYPAEINPFVRLDPSRKACPPEAWALTQPLMQRGGRLISAQVRDDIKRSREADEQAVSVKQRLCAVLNLSTVALSCEGFVVYSPDRQGLLTGLNLALSESECVIDETDWHFVSNSSESVDSLVSRGAVAALVGTSEPVAYEYLAFNSPSAGVAA
jgi:Fe-S-cluster containining protein